MGSSDTGGVSDCSVGSIVWVRRRNGSWWPGKIMGTEEIPAAHVTSPRSGTPVKLLGREDASVDWYNLEKSKRVKAFRCGEFDNCIERAEAAQGMPPKKREKYARREDAILHALELERQLMEKKYGKTGNSFCARSQASPDAITSSQYVGTGRGKQRNLLSDQPFCSSLFEKNGTDQHMYEDNYRGRDQRSGEDDGAGLFPRMRGLQDFGLRTTPSSRGELPGAPFRAKRSKHADIQYDSVDSAHDTQTVSSSMEIVVSKVEESNYPVNAGKNQISGSTEDTETDCSETDSLESDSDEDMTGISDGSASIELHPKYPGRIEVREDHGSISSSDDIDGFAYGNGLSHPFPHRPVASGTSVSKWQLKGKRNNRNLEKRAFEASDIDVSSGYMNHRKFNRRKSISKADLMDKSFSTHIPRHLSTGLHSSNEINDLEAWAWNNQSATRGYMEDGMEYVVGKHYFGGRGVLIDVELQVKANNYKRDAPMISLTSKLNGHAIVGHSIQVEPLENGSSAKLVPTADCFSSEPLGSPTLPCVWRTGRRTANFRVPRPFVSSILDCNSRETAQLVNHGVEHPFTSNHGRIHQQASMARRSFSQYPVERKFSRNSPKKISQSPNQKIRSLSSIPAQDKHNSDPNTGAVHRADGLNKTENIPAVAACIPVNLVFSRLHEELGWPASVTLSEGS